MLCDDLDSCILVDGTNVRTWLFSYLFHYRWKRLAVDVRHEGAAHIGCNQDEDSQTGRAQCRKLKRPVPDVLVLSENDPVPRGQGFEPNSILRIMFEMVAMILDLISGVLN